MPRRVLITRDPERAADLLHALAAAGIDTIAEPVTFSRRITGVLPFDDWSTIDTIAFTSATAVKYYAEILREFGRELSESLRLACVGPATMEAVRHEWRHPDIVADGSGALALADTLQNNSLDKTLRSVLWPCAREALPDFADMLNKAGITVLRWPVYSTEPVPPDQLRSHLGDISAFSVVVFAAPSAVRGLLKAWPGQWTFTAVAIGETTAKEVGRLSSVRCVTSRSPQTSDLMNAIQHALHTPESISAEPHRKESNL